MIERSRSLGELMESTGNISSTGLLDHLSAQAAAMSSEIDSIKQAQLHEEQRIRQAFNAEMAQIDAHGKDRAGAIDADTDAQLQQLKTEYKASKQRIQADRDSKIAAAGQQKKMLENNAAQKATYAQRQAQARAHAAAHSLKQRFHTPIALGPAGTASTARALTASSQVMPAINITSGSTGRYAAAAGNNQVANMAGTQSASTTFDRTAAQIAAATGYGQRAVDGAAQAIQSTARINSVISDNTGSETAPLTLAAAAAAVAKKMQHSTRHK
jgi:hypothetical protein